MASKEDLQGSFGSLIDTLRSRFDPFQPEDIVAEWTGLMARAAALARKVAAWNALPDRSPQYDGALRALDEATRALVVADFSLPETVRSALRKVDRALDLVGQLL